MRLAVAATPQVAFQTLEYLLSGKDPLVKVFTTEDKAIGRGRNLAPSDVAVWASEHGIECIKVGKAVEMAAHLDDIDCVVTVPSEYFFHQRSFQYLHMDLLISTSHFCLHGEVLLQSNERSKMAMSNWESRSSH